MAVRGRLIGTVLVATFAAASSCHGRNRGNGSTTTTSSVDAGFPAASASIDPLPAAGPAPSYAVRYDRLGYSDGPRWGVMVGAEPPAHHRLYDLGTERFIGEGAPISEQRHLDLSRLRVPGRYLVVFEDGARFGPIVVGDDVYAQVLPAMLRFLRAQRCGATSVEVSQHGACHLHASITDKDPRTHSGDAVSVDDHFGGRVTDELAKYAAVDLEGGWHDAGDYVKFVGTTSFVLAIDLMTLRDRGPALSTPRLGAIKDDLRIEMRWGLDWLTKMLGGAELHHQVSGVADHEAAGFRTPEHDTEHALVGYAHRPAFRFARGRGRNLLGRAAAAFALGAQVFADDSPYAARLLGLARRSYAEAKREARALPQLSVPSDWYPESSCNDDLTLAAATLARATSDEAIKAEALADADALTTPPGTALGWSDVDAIALLETASLFPEGSAERGRIAAKLIALAAPIRSNALSSRGPGAPYHYALSTFGNGSIAESLGAAALCLAAIRVGGAAECRDVARDQLHWLFGRNPFGISFMVGVGDEYPRDIHHALAQASHLTLTGAIVGGPTNARTLRDDALAGLPKKVGPFAKWSTSDLLYEDVSANYVVNEPAIDFTAPLVFVLAELAE